MLTPIRFLNTRFAGIGISLLTLASILTFASLTATAAPDNTVDVTLNEYKIEMPATLPAGTTVFKVTNAGAKKHDFQIKGNGLDEKLTTDLKQGESGTLQVNLKPGTYKVYCPIMGHSHKGMTLELTVTK